MFSTFNYVSNDANFDIPQVVSVRQHFDAHAITDISASVTRELERPEIASTIRAGAEIAIGVGSRGIANLARIIQSLIKSLKARGAKPFVFPAMGSHGGATAEGQQAVLESYGITSSSIGAPIRATMDVVERASMMDGTPIYVDRYASEADGIILVNRIKPHTAFRGAIESGIVKMMIIGMGKIAGASIMHRDKGMDRFGSVLPKAANHLMPHIPLLFGLGLIEDAYDQTALIEAVPVAHLVEREEALLQIAKSYMPRLFFEEIDVLVIDEIGKEISGGGFDPNIAGRNCRGVTGFDALKINKLVILGLSKHTHGNATGVGLADVITRRLFEAIDFQSTYTNVITSTYLDGAAIPIIMETGVDAVKLAIRAVPRVRPGDVRLVRIKDTLALSEIEVSQALLEAVRQHPKMEVTSPLKPLEVDP